MDKYLLCTVNGMPILDTTFLHHQIKPVRYITVANTANTSNKTRPIT